MATLFISPVEEAKSISFLHITSALVPCRSKAIPKSPEHTMETQESTESDARSKATDRPTTLEMEPSIDIDDDMPNIAINKVREVTARFSQTLQ